ncbi:MAG TPA: hypothetical protein VG148_13380 [Pyrinomonadaceae bacterium]|nr:hypothetical protein [Pyrinomonadaceae bacterium]
MKAETNIPDRLFLTEGEKIERILRRAVRHALLAHKRAGNTVAAWEGGRVVLIPADEIHVEELKDDGQ